MVWRPSLPPALSGLLKPRRPEQALCCTALSRNPSLEGAVAELAAELRRCGLPRGSDGAGADLALVFCSTAYASDLQRLLPLLRQAVPARHWLGCACGGVVGTDPDGTPHELESQPAISLTVISLPGCTLQPFRLEPGRLPDLDGPSHQWIDWVGGDPLQSHSMLLLVDPGCPSINDLISGLDYAYPNTVKVGGIAGQHSASHGSLLFDDQVVEGAIGCLIAGPWRIDPVVAKGCEERQRTPLAERGMRDQRLAARCPAPDRRHVGLGPGFIDEDEPTRIKPPLILLPLRPAPRDLWARLLGGEQAFF
jgi:small ligand-binding sensory domain FIST